MNRVQTGPSNPPSPSTPTKGIGLHAILDRYGERGLLCPCDKGFDSRLTARRPRYFDQFHQFRVAIDHAAQRGHTLAVPEPDHETQTVQNRIFPPWHVLHLTSREAKVCYPCLRTFGYLCLGTDIKH